MYSSHTQTNTPAPTHAEIICDLVSVMVNASSSSRVARGFLSCETSAMFSCTLNTHNRAHLFRCTDNTSITWGTSSSCNSISVAATEAATASRIWKSSSSSSSSTNIVIRRLSANNTQSFYEEFTLSLSHHIFAEERWLNENGPSLPQWLRAYTRDTFNRTQFTTIQCRRCHPFFFLSQFSFHSLLLPTLHFHSF